MCLLYPMLLQADTLRTAFANKIAAVAASLGDATLSAKDVYEQLVLPPNPEMGDLSFGTFRLAKTLKSAPPALAQKIAAAIPADEIFGVVQAAGPYVNITFTAQALGEQVAHPARSGDLFKRPLTKGEPRTMVEYSQPNTHKELHVGHMRNLTLGDAIVRMLRGANVDTIAATFPGDMGTHVAKCLWYMKKHNKEAVPDKDRGEWLGTMYSKANIKLEDETGTPQEEKNRQELTVIINQLEAKKGEYYELWKETRQWSIALMEQVYKWAGVEFDKWYWESEVDADSVATVKKYYAEGKMVLSEGAIGVDLNAENLGFCLLLKSDGTGLYATKDLELARRKFQDYKIHKNVYVVDVRQALHFKQVFKVLEKLGFPHAKDCFHLQYNFVELPDGAMSSRKGNIVPIMDLINQMEDLIKKQFLNRYVGEWSVQEIEDVAEIVAKGAIKYGMLRIDTNKKIVFDMAEWLRLDGESGPFIQYSYARIASLVRKQAYDPDAAVKWELLTHPAEHQLMRQMMNYPQLISNAALDFKPAMICGYLYDLAKLFNVFYHECPIGSVDSAELKGARLGLSAAVGATLKQGLSLLGIPVPEKM